MKVASDFLEVVNGLHNANLGVFVTVLLEIKDRARQRSSSFVHERRETNGEAYRMHGKVRFGLVGR